MYERYLGKIEVNNVKFNLNFHFLYFSFFSLGWGAVWTSKNDQDKAEAVKKAVEGATKYLDKFSEILESNGEFLENIVNYKLK